MKRSRGQLRRGFTKELQTEKFSCDGRFSVEAIPLYPVIPQNPPKSKASGWLTPQEVNVNNNNSPVAPIRGLLFGGKLEERNCHHPPPHQTSNHAQLVQRKSRMVLYSKASSASYHKSLIILCFLPRDSEGLAV